MHGRAGCRKVIAVLLTAIAGVGLADVGEAFAAGGAPLVEATAVRSVTAESVTVSSTVNPEGFATEGYFEYGGCSSPSTCVASAFTASTQPGELGNGSASVRLGPTIIQLPHEGTTYHVRSVARNEHGVERGPEAVFTTQVVGGFALPDQRVWEMVSPASKNGALIEGLEEEPRVIQAAASGDSITYLASSPVQSGQPPGFANLQQLISTRPGASGWSTRDLDIPHPAAVGQTVGRGQEYRFFSEDLSSGVFQPFGSFVALSPYASEQTPYLGIDFTSGSPEQTCEPSAQECDVPLAVGCPASPRPCPAATAAHADVLPETVFGIPNEGYFKELYLKHISQPRSGTECPPAPMCGPQFVGATPDAKHIMLRSEVPLTPDAPPATGEDGLYEWSEGRLSPVGILPVSEGGGPTEAVLGSEPIGSESVERNAVSSDGSRVVFTAGESHLYLRDMSRGETIRLDGEEPGSGTAIFEGASSDGSRVWFTDSSRLTSDASGEKDLYECEVVTAASGKLECRLRDLTPMNGEGENTRMQGYVLGASERGCDVGSGEECALYFVADSVLAPGAVPGTCEKEVFLPEAVCNLYVVRDGVTHLVAVVSGEDRADWEGDGSQDQLLARVSPNGLYLAFFSDRGLTGYVSREAESERPVEELYVFGAQSGSLACVSCEPTGARPTGIEAGESGDHVRLLGSDESWEPGSVVLAADLPAWSSYEVFHSVYQPRAISDLGRVWFDAFDSLVPKDTNGTWDVYEWEPVGVGSCGPGSSDGAVAFKPGGGFEVEGRAGFEGAGCVGLLSSGASPQESVLMDGSVSGGDVFFLTTAQLSPGDFDHSYDVYDAHECTAGSPCPPVGAPAAASECVSAEACRAAPSAAPGVFGAPSSASFSGVDNVPPPAPAAAGAPVRLTAAQELAKALKACKADRRKRRRLACEAAARKRYAPKTKKGKKTKGSKKAKKSSGMGSSAGGGR